MFEKFSNEGKAVITRASEEARMLRHSYVGTEHLLLAILDQHEMSPLGYLDSVGVAYDTVRAKIEHAIGAGQSKSRRHLSFTAHYKEVSLQAVSVMVVRGHDLLEPAHLLYAMVRAEKNTAHELLKGLGVDLDALRVALDHYLVPVPKPIQVQFSMDALISVLSSDESTVGEFLEGLTGQIEQLEAQQTPNEVLLEKLKHVREGLLEAVTKP